MDNQSNNLIKFQLESANVFKLIISILITFFTTNILTINYDFAIIIGIVFIIFGVILCILKHQTIAFYVLSGALGVLLFANSAINTDIIDISNNFSPPQSAIIHGEIKQILKKSADRQRILVEGTVDTKYFPNLQNTSVIMTLIGNKSIKLGDSVLLKCNVNAPTDKVFDNDFDEKRYIHSFGASLTGWVYEKNIVILSQKSSFKSCIYNITQHIERKIDTLFTTETSNFVKAILLADKSELSPEIKKSFQITGVSHILAVSGFHLGIISAIIWVLLSFIPLNRWIKFIIFCLAIISFGILTNLQPPVIRAGSMAMLFLFGKTMQRETNWLNIISIVLLITIIVSPGMLYSVSFQMSLFSIIGIFFFYEVFKNFIKSIINNKFINSDNKIFDYFINSIAITLSATIIINPLVVYYFNTFSVISPLTNIIIIPLFSIGLLFAFISIVFSFIFFPLAIYYAYIVEITTKLCYKIVDFFAVFQYSAIATSDIILSIIFSILIIYCAFSIHKKQFIFRILVAVIFASLSVFLLNSNNFDTKTVVYPKLYSKSSYNLLSIPLNDNTLFVWLADRKPYQKYYKDIGLIQYIKENNIKHIAINGSFGEQFVKENCSGKDYTIRRLNFAQQQALEKKYLNGKYISQIISLE